MCSKNHSSLLHHKKEFQEQISSKAMSRDSHKAMSRDNSGHQSTDQSSFSGSSVVCANSHQGGNQYVLLSTAIVGVKDKFGQVHNAQVVLDSGSQCSFISSEFQQKLGLDLSPFKINISGINNTNSSLKWKCNVTIGSKINGFDSALVCLVVPRITEDLPAHKIHIKDWVIPSHVQLANPFFNVTRKVDILIGADLFWNILLDGKISLGRNKPLLINTVFGYVVTGSIGLPLQSKVRCNLAINDDLQKFWSIEEIHNELPRLTKEEQFCEEYFDKTVSRDNLGRFVVRFPLKSSYKDLGDSKQLAIKRPMLQENRLKENDLLKTKYTSFMNEYLQLGHMNLVSDSKMDTFRCFCLILQ